MHKDPAIKMKRVEPIRDTREIQLMLDKLGDWNEMYRMLFLIGIHTGLRIKERLRASPQHSPLMQSLT